jgi:hypothetical protein
MEKINRGLFWSIIASESIHIFCCVLPTLFSVLSLLAGMGVIATMPLFIDNMHHIIHDYEIPMIIASGVILAFGWALHAYSRRISCRTEGSCSHEPCTPKKDRTRLFMIIATVLFIVNVTVYFVFHRQMDAMIHGEAGVEYKHHDHDHHHH